MTRQTALALIRCLDANRELAAAGRLTRADYDAVQSLWDRVLREDTAPSYPPHGAPQGWTRVYHQRLTDDEREADHPGGPP